MKIAFAKSTIVATAALAAASVSAQGPIYCAGTVSNSYISKEGHVIFKGSWAPSYTQVCNVEVTWKGIPPNVCVGWLAKIDAAVSLGKTIQVRYYENLTCDTLPSYFSAPAPDYLMLI